jgi:hypothetical protein
MVLYAFGVGLANFGSGRERSPSEVVAAVRDALPVVAWYGATGNVALQDGDIDDVRLELKERTGTTWAVIGAEHLEHGLTLLAALPEPLHTPDERPTPGLAFGVTTSADGDVISTERAVLRRISADMVAAWKLDVLRAGKLDPNRRRGGWGALSTDIARQVGGRWTARSRRTIDGLRGRVLARP